MANFSYEQLFSQKQKANAFDRIAEQYFYHNFGTFSKAQMDTLMFDIYFSAIIDDTAEDGVIDYSALSDYKIGSILGLTPARVRNLKLRKELTYPRKDFEWRASLINVLSNEKNLNIDNDWLIVTIGDPNLYNAVQDALEEHGAYVDITLNSHILRVKQKALIDFFETLAGVEEVTNLNREIKARIEKNASKSEKLSIILNNGCQMTDIAANLFTILEAIPGLGSGLKIAKAIAGISNAVLKASNTTLGRV